MTPSNLHILMLGFQRHLRNDRSWGFRNSMIISAVQGPARNTGRVCVCGSTTVDHPMQAAMRSTLVAESSLNKSCSDAFLLSLLCYQRIRLLGCFLRRMPIESDALGTERSEGWQPWMLLEPDALGAECSLGWQRWILLKLNALGTKRN